tara:strand:- start:1481 stop:1873 length:393 start_codon:yes stop_codon:yes gene_type:complete
VSQKDWNKLAKFEQAISKKYGAEAVQNPKANWDDEKEKDYLGQIKKLAEKETQLQEKNEKVDINGVLIPKKLLNRESNRTCPVCDAYSFDVRDDVYMNKYDCCRLCYVKYVEDREDRWQSGWRPNNGNDT